MKGLSWCSGIRHYMPIEVLMRDCRKTDGLYPNVTMDPGDLGLVGQEGKRLVDFAAI